MSEVVIRSEKDYNFSKTLPRSQSPMITLLRKKREQLFKSRRASEGSSSNASEDADKSKQSAGSGKQKVVENNNKNGQQFSKTQQNQKENQTKSSVKDKQKTEIQSNELKTEISQSNKQTVLKVEQLKNVEDSKSLKQSSQTDERATIKQTVVNVVEPNKITEQQQQQQQQQQQPQTISRSSVSQQQVLATTEQQKQQVTVCVINPQQIKVAQSATPNSKSNVLKQQDQQTLKQQQEQQQQQQQQSDMSSSSDPTDPLQKLQQLKQEQLDRLDQLLGLHNQMGEDAICKENLTVQKSNTTGDTIIIKSAIIENQIKSDRVGITTKQDTGVSQENSRSETPSIVDQKVKEWNTKMADISANNGTITDGVDSENSLKNLKPLKIADYEPGKPSIAKLSGPADEEYNPPVEKPGAFCRYTESDSEADYRTRKLDRPFSPSQSDDVHELYRSVQRGGHIPQEGIKIPQEIRKGHTLSHVASHYYNPNLCASESRHCTKTRQERDLENILRKKRVEQVISEEKKKRLMQTERDIASRRHCDYFIPTHKTLVPLDRYESDDSYQNSPTSFLHRPKLGPKVRGKARALYNFRAQNSRELSFRRGDYVYLLRQVDQNWFKGERHGLVGIFPIKYVEVITSIGEAQAQATEGEGLARALFNFSAQTSLELSLRKGDVVKLIRRVDENWYEGRLGNSKAYGIFPVLYVEALVEPSTPYMTPSCSRAVTPMIGSPGYASPTSSLYSVGPAPTIPSAPMSPAESEIFDESQFLFSDWCSSPNRWAANNRPASAASRHYNPRDWLREDSRGGSCYYSSSGLDGIGFDTRPPIRTSKSFGAGSKTHHVGFAKNVKNIMSAYQFDEREENGHLNETKSNHSALKDSKQKESKNEDFSYLLYPPYRALYSYTPRRNDELRLTSGDIVYVVERGSDGWFVGTNERTKEFGTFPGNYVERL